MAVVVWRFPAKIIAIAVSKMDIWCLTKASQFL
jgi:hypothetical protein